MVQPTSIIFISCLSSHGDGFIFEYFLHKAASHILPHQNQPSFNPIFTFSQLSYFTATHRMATPFPLSSPPTTES